MKEKIIDAIRNAAWWFCLMWGTIMSGVSLVLVFMAMLGHIPIWHPAVAAFAAMLILSAGYLVS